MSVHLHKSYFLHCPLCEVGWRAKDARHCWACGGRGVRGDLPPTWMRAPEGTTFGAQAIEYGKQRGIKVVA